MSAWARTSRSPVTLQKRAYYLRFRVDDRPGIIAKLAGILASKHISLEAVLQEPCDTKDDLPFVITVEPTVGAIHPRGRGRDVAARFHAGSAAGAAHGDGVMKAGRCCLPRWRWLPDLPAQVASQANSGYQTEQQRQAIARGLGNPERDQTQRPGELVRAMGSVSRA